MYHVFNGQRYKVNDISHLPNGEFGDCDNDNHIIRIPRDGDTLDELDTITHEALHAGMPFLAEECVTANAKSVSTLLWRLGWRKEE